MAHELRRVVEIPDAVGKLSSNEKLILTHDSIQRVTYCGFVRHQIENVPSEFLLAKSACCGHGSFGDAIRAGQGAHATLGVTA